MKVCHMTSAHSQEDVRIFHKECVSLANAGFEVYLVERGDSYDKKGVHIIGVGEIPVSRIKRMTQGAKKVYEKALALDCDIYHFHDPELLPYGLKLKKKGKKVIFDSHENTSIMFEEKDYLPGFIRKTLGRAYAAYEKSICSRLESVVTVTPTQTDYFKKINHNTVEVTNYPIFSEDYCEPSFKKKAVAFAGGISRQWNHEMIVRALEEVPGCTFILCGPDNEYRKGLESLPAWNQVEYKGKIPHKEVARVLSECMVGMALLTPGLNTAWNIGTIGNTKIFEEMMAGLPVICTDFVLWREFVDRYRCGICVDPTSKTDVVSAMQTLLSDPVAAKKMGQNGRYAVQEEFNWSTQEIKLIELYRGLEG